jgi:HAMP domain-containing protein
VKASDQLTFQNSTLDGLLNYVPTNSPVEQTINESYSDTSTEVVTLEDIDQPKANGSILGDNGTVAFTAATSAIESAISSLPEGKQDATVVEQPIAPSYPETSTSANMSDEVGKLVSAVGEAADNSTSSNSSAEGSSENELSSVLETLNRGNDKRLTQR